MAKVLIFETEDKLTEKEVKHFEQLLENAYDKKNDLDPALTALKVFAEKKDTLYLSPRISKMIKHFTIMSNVLNELVDVQTAFSGLTLEDIEEELRREDESKEGVDETKN